MTVPLPDSFGIVTCRNVCTSAAQQEKSALQNLSFCSALSDFQLCFISEAEPGSFLITADEYQPAY